MELRELANDNDTLIARGLNDQQIVDDLELSACALELVAYLRGRGDGDLQL